LDGLGRELAKVEARESDAQGLAHLRVPSELAPIVARIGSLTLCLQEALERERRTTASIAHELRTPIAELRAMAEVALQTPEDAGASAETLAECRQLAIDMQGMIGTLLAMARSRAAGTFLEVESLEVVELTRKLWDSLGERARSRRVHWEFRTLADQARVQGNAEALRTVLSNLFQNACSYTPEGGRAECSCEPLASGVRIGVTNTVVGVLPADLERFGEAFWRADAARGDRSHFGLGLALARECAAAAGMQLHFRLDGERLSATLEIGARARDYQPKG
jgi:two-component system sensor histidine kinase QseC